MHAAVESRSFKQAVSLLCAALRKVRLPQPDAFPATGGTVPWEHFFGVNKSACMLPGINEPLTLETDPLLRLGVVESASESSFTPSTPMTVGSRGEIVIQDSHSRLQRAEASLQRKTTMLFSAFPQERGSCCENMVAAITTLADLGTDDMVRLCSARCFAVVREQPVPVRATIGGNGAVCSSRLLCFAFSF